MRTEETGVPVLKGYVALITGGSSGMGFEMAKQLLSQGATVVIAARPGKKLDAAAAALSESVGELHAVGMDVTDEGSVAAAAEWFRAHFDRLDMLVNNAGIGANAPGMEDLPPNPRFYEIPVTTARAVVETNFLGAFTVTRYFLPLMLPRKQGRLIYVSTSDGTRTRAGQFPYGPSKAGAEAMTAIMAQELRDTGITVNVICPGGFTDTPMAGKGAKESFLKNNLPILPPTVLNRAIAFLASPLSDGIHGEKIVGRDFDAWLDAKGIRSSD